VLKFLVIVALFAVTVYFVTRLLQQRGAGGRRPQLQRRRPQPPPRVQGPDDDEDFLRDLDRKRRHSERPEDPDA
jgi:hypothetical protein